MLSLRGSGTLVSVGAATVLLVACAWKPARAVPAGAEPIAGPSPWIRLLEGPVRRAVGRRWNVAPERIGLSWIRTPAHAPPEVGPDSVRLVGTGSGGRWLVEPLFSDRERSSSTIRVQARIRRMQAVAARALERGDTLSEADIEEASVLVKGPPPLPELPQVEGGWVVARAVEPGEPLLPPTVRPPHVVRSGEELEAVWRNGTVAVRLEATAMEHATAGEELRVRTTHGAILRGIAVRPDVVAIGSGTGGGGQ